MPITGEIQSLYKDKDKTKLIFPTTKIKAISDDDGVGLNVLLEHMVYSDPEDMEIAATPINADVLGGFPASDYATKTYVSNKIAEVQLEGSDVDLSGYVTKDELTSTINNINYPVDSVNGKIGAVQLSASDVGARPDTWLPTAAEIGAAPADLDVHFCDGEVLAVQNSGDAPLHSLKIYGKTVQNGTPTPENPVPLVSVGDGVSVAVTVCGKNLFSETERGTINTSGENEDNTYIDRTKGYISVTPNTKYYLSTYNTDENRFVLCEYDKHHVFLNRTPLDYVKFASDFKATAFTTGSNTRYVRLYVASGAYNPDKTQLEKGTQLTEYEPYKDGGSVTVQTPNGLPGIPVPSGGNYTDENGQQWICDEIDFSRGKYVKRIVRYEKTFTIPTISTSGGLGFVNLTDIPYPVNCVRGVLSNIASLVAGNDITSISNQGWGKTQACISAMNYNGGYILRFYGPVGSYNATFLVATDAPIEHDLTAEEIAQYSALHTNYPNTTIYNNVGAYMDMEYYSPNSALPVALGSGRAGQILTVDEHGCVTSLPNPMVESLEHRGCYYRSANGTIEWINPPMVIGVEYRLTDRWDGQIAYAKLVDVGKLANAGKTSVSVADGVNVFIDYELVLVNYDDNTYQYVNTADISVNFGHNFPGTSNNTSWVDINTKSDLSAFTGYLLVKYTKV